METKEEPKTTLRAILTGDKRAKELDYYRVESFELCKDGWRDIPPHDATPEQRAAILAEHGSCSYGHVHAAEMADADLVTHDALCGSDYSGGALPRANRRAVDEAFKEGTFTAHGGHGTECRYFILDAPIPEDKAREAAELLFGLCDYPVADEDALSEVEHEDEDEAWDSYACRDFANGLAKRFGFDDDMAADSEKLRAMFAVVAGRENLNGGPGIDHEEDGASFMIDEAVEGTPILLASYFGVLASGIREELVALAIDETPEARDHARYWSWLDKAGDSLRRLARIVGEEVIQGAEFPELDLPEGLSARALELAELRSFTVTLTRFVYPASPGSWEKRTVAVTIDPLAFGRPNGEYIVNGKPYGVFGVKDALAEFLA